MKQLLTEGLILNAEVGVIFSSLKLRIRQASYPSPKPGCKAEGKWARSQEHSVFPSVSEVISILRVTHSFEYLRKVTVSSRR